MNNKLILLDRINNGQKEANMILKFTYNDFDYIIYYTEENNKNRQIFVSKIIMNSEGKTFISDIVSEEKNKLNTIVYNIVIVSPTESLKSDSKEVILNNLENKFSIKLSLDLPNVNNANYFPNSRVAVTSEALIINANNFYNEVLKKEIKEENSLINDNTSISDFNQIVQESSNEVNKKDIVTNVDSDIPVFKKINSEINIEDNSEEEINQINDEINPQMNILNSNNNINQNLFIKKETTQLNNDVSDKNNDELNNEGFIINKSIVIGTVCILLSVIIVTVTFILIKRMLTGV